MIGQTISHYRILDKLGEGGMGVVFLAEDQSLKREVALKILPAELASDPERLARFRREAEAIAVLNHPSIVTIHSVEEADGVHFYTMERVEGSRLDELTPERGLALDRWLDLAKQLAAALAAAHDKGITHRDLKPANVMVTDDGRLKILDFGLAKLRLRPTGEEASEVATATLTADGRVLGTTAYMSPEQALGKPVDHRSDIFSLGILLYEMAGGKRPFEGENHLSVMSSIIRDPPLPLPQIHPEHPRDLWRIINRCLQKDPLRRYQSAIDLRNDILELAQEVESGVALPRAASPPASERRIWRRVAIATLFPLAVLAVWMLWPRPRPAPLPILRFTVSLPEGEHLLGMNRQGFALSPDGSRLAYVAGLWDQASHTRSDPRILVQPLDRREPLPLSGTDRALDLAVSPDGEWIAFSTLEPPVALRKVPIGGGDPVTLCGCAAHYGLAWSPNGTIFFAEQRGGLQRVSAAGGDPRPVTELDDEAGELSHRLPYVLPGGEVVLYTALRHDLGAQDWSKARIYAQVLASGERKLLVEGGSDGRYLPSGHLVFAREGSLLAAPFDLRRLELTGVEAPVLEGVSHAVHTPIGYLETGRALYSFSQSGLLAYAAGSVYPEEASRLVWVDRQGREEPLGIEPRAYVMVRLSPDGRQALLTRNYSPYDVRLFDLERATFRRQTFEGIVSFAAWGPGDGRFTVASDAGGPRRLYTKKIDAGPAGLELVTERDLTAGAPADWTPDGRQLVFVDRPGASFDILTLDDDGRVEPLLDTRLTEKYPALSPDGRWLAYTSDESGRTEVFVRPFPGPGRAAQVSIGGGEAPGWSKDGTEIFYRELDLSSQRLMAVAVHAEGERLTVGGAVALFDVTGYSGSTPLRSWDVAVDGRFLFFKTIGNVEAEIRERFAPERIHMVQNWLAEIEAANTRQR